MELWRKEKWASLSNIQEKKIGEDTGGGRHARGLANAPRLHVGTAMQESTQPNLHPVAWLFFLAASALASAESARGSPDHQDTKCESSGRLELQ